MRTSMITLSYAALALLPPDTPTTNPNAESVEVEDGAQQSAGTVEGGTVREGGKDNTIELGAPADVATTGEPEADADKPDEEEGDKPDEEPAEGALPPRPEAFDPADPENIKSFDAAFKREDGTMHMDNLSREWWDNQAKAGEDQMGHLSDATYEYIQHQFGVSKDDVKRFEQAQVALNKQNAGQLHERAGGAEQLGQMLKWGRDGGGYTPAQIEAFNKALDAGGETALDAIDLLRTRFENANKSGTRPAKTTSDGPGNGGPSVPSDVFASKADWLAARKDAGNDMDKQAAVSAKFRRSPGAARW